MHVAGLSQVTSADRLSEFDLLNEDLPRTGQISSPKLFSEDRHRRPALSSSTLDAARYWVGWNRARSLDGLVTEASRSLARQMVSLLPTGELPLSSALTLMSLSREGRSALDTVIPILNTLPESKWQPLVVRLDFASSDCAAPVTALRSPRCLVTRAADLGRSGFLALLYASLPEDNAGALVRLREELYNSMEVDELRVATLNIAGLPRWLKGERFMPDPSEPSRVIDRYAQIGRLLRNRAFDLVGLQEMFDPRTAALLQEAAFPFCARGSSTHGFLGVLRGDGLMILSRYPIEWSELRPFSETTGVERLVRKGALFARVALPGGRKLLVTNVHAISSTSYITSERAAKIRKSQMEELCGWQRELRTPGTDELILGDFNTDLDRCPPLGGSRADLYRLRYSQHNPCPHRAAGFTFDLARNRRAAEFVFSENGAESERIDGLYVSERLHNSVAAMEMRLEFAESSEQVSDHFGVSARMMLRR